MKKVGKAFLDLEKSEFTGFSSTRLNCYSKFQWKDTPTIGVKVDSHLFEQKGNGLIGHHVDLKLDASLGADGEIDLLPLLATTPRCKFLTQPLLRDSRERLEELCVRFGIFLRAQGRASLQLSASSERPVTDWSFAARARDQVALGIEGRAEDELTTLWIESSTDSDFTASPTIAFRGSAPGFAERQKSLLDHSFLADAHFTGVRLNALVLAKLGAVTVAAAPPENGFQLLSPNAWPPGAKTEEMAGIMKW